MALDLLTRIFRSRESDTTFDTPHFEPMETRLMLSVTVADIQAKYPDLDLSGYTNSSIIEITANEAALHSAIVQAGTTTGNDLIVVNTTVALNTITLTDGQISININATNFGSVMIVSLGDKPLTIDADGKSRVMSIGENAAVALAGLTITGGYVTYGGGGTYGGGIYNSGTLTVTKSIIEGNMADSGSNYYARGGGIYSTGTLTVSNSTIKGNTVFGSSSYSANGGGVYSNGTLTVTKSIIEGNTAFRSGTYSASGGGIYGTGTLTVTDSTIKGNTVSAPLAYGGGIYSGGTLTVTNSTIEGNTVSGSGGGIYSSGPLTVTNSTIKKNKANEFSGETNIVVGGGGIYQNYGTAVVTNSIILENTTANNGGGVCLQIGSFTLIDSTVSDNISGRHGGGIYSENMGGGSASITLTDSVVTGNTATSRGGGIYTGNNSFMTITGLTITRNTADLGGGICNHRTLTVTDSAIINNTAHSHGGGIYNDYALTVTDSAIINNTAHSHGGGIYNAANLGYNDRVELTSVTISGNTAALGGGGICNARDVIYVYNSIISENTAGTNGGGISNHGYGYVTAWLTNSLVTGNTAGSSGGGIYNYGDGSLSAYLLMTNSTVTGNIATINGGGVYNSSNATLDNSIVVNNSGTDIFSHSANYVATEGYYNLTTFTGWDGSSRDNILYNSGKPLFVDAANGNYQLIADSQAIDKGSNYLYTTYSWTEEDLAGNSRIYNGTIDIGAYEYQGGGTVVAPSTPTGLTSTSRTTAGITLSWNASAGATSYKLEYSPNGTSGWTQIGGTIAGTSYTHSSLAANTNYYYRVSAVNSGGTSAPTASLSVKTLAESVGGGDTATTTNAVASSVTTRVDGFSAITLTWKEPAARSIAAGLKVVAYRIYDGNVLIGTVLVSEVGANNEFKFTMDNAARAAVGLPAMMPRTTYSLRVEVVCETKASGTEAGGAEVVSGRAVAKKVKTAGMTAVKLVGAQAGDRSLNSVTLRWQPHVDAAEFIVTCLGPRHVAVALIFDGPTPNAVWLREGDNPSGRVVGVKITGLFAGTTYRVSVGWSNAAVNVSSSASTSTARRSLSTMKFPATKTPSLQGSLTTSAPGVLSATLTWPSTPPPSGATGGSVTGSVTYEVYYSEWRLNPNAAAGWTKSASAATVAGDAVTATLAGLPAGKTYYVYVRSIWIDGDGVEQSTVFSNSGVTAIKTTP